MEVFKASPRDRAQQRFVEQTTSFLQFLTVVLEREVFKVFPEDRVPQRLPLSRPSFLLVEVFKGFPRDRVPQRLPVSRPSFLLVEIEVTLLFRKMTEWRPQLRVHARRTRPLHFRLQGILQALRSSGVTGPLLL